ncbi:PAS domain-containing sensor histidine kinase [Terrimonas alba]|uniref:PAS domain-containing sensor histidine kinase n=1 Tax=Terrimonas alba TaxID=3349636 RepID=UPI0035F2FF7D
MDILKNDLLNALCNNLKEGVAIASATTGQIVFCNDTWLELFDLESISEMDMGRLNNWRKIKTTEAETRARISEADEKGIFIEEVEYTSKAGHSFWGEVSIRPFWNKGEHYYLIGIDPIDKMKEGEQKIAQERQRFDALLEYASLGVIETNCHAEIINVNPFALSLFGYERNELINKKIELLIPSRFHSRHVEHRREYIQHSRNRPMGVGMDLFAIKKNGTEFPVEVSLSSYNKNGDKCVIAFVSDISIRKEAERVARQLNDKLEETVNQRTKELKQAIQELELSKDELSKSLEKEKELSELKSRFVSMASHEFRTPLSTVLSSAYLLQKYTSGEDQPKRERHLKRIISSVNMLTDILNDFLSVGKIEEGKSMSDRKSSISGS